MQIDGGMHDLSTAKKWDLARLGPSQSFVCTGTLRSGCGTAQRREEFVQSEVRFAETNQEVQMTADQNTAYLREQGLSCSQSSTSCVPIGSTTISASCSRSNASGNCERHSSDAKDRRRVRTKLFRTANARTNALCGGSHCGRAQNEQDQCSSARNSCS